MRSIISLFVVGALSSNVDDVLKSLNAVGSGSSAVDTSNASTKNDNSAANSLQGLLGNPSLLNDPTALMTQLLGGQSSPLASMLSSSNAFGDLTQTLTNSLSNLAGDSGNAILNTLTTPVNAILGTGGLANAGGLLTGTANTYDTSKNLQSVDSSASTANSGSTINNDPTQLLSSLGLDPTNLLNSLTSAGASLNPTGLLNTNSLLGNAGNLLNTNNLLNTTQLLGQTTDLLNTTQLLGKSSQLLQGASALTGLLGGTGTDNQLSTLLGNSGDMLSSINGLLSNSGVNNLLNTADPSKLLQSVTGGLTGTTSGLTNNAQNTFGGIADAYVTNNYLNSAGQNALKLTGLATQANQYPDLAAALNGQSPVTDSDGQLTQAVQLGLKQIGIDAKTPAEMVSAALSQQTKRQLSSWFEQAMSSLGNAAQKVSSNAKDHGIENAFNGDEWKSDVQNAANQLAEQLQKVSTELKGGNVPDQIQTWWGNFSKEMDDKIESFKRDISSNHNDDDGDDDDDDKKGLLSVSDAPAAADTNTTSGSGQFGYYPASVESDAIANSYAFHGLNDTTNMASNSINNNNQVIGLLQALQIQQQLQQQQQQQYLQQILAGMQQRKLEEADEDDVAAVAEVSTAPAEEAVSLANSTVVGNSVQNASISSGANLLGSVNNTSLATLLGGTQPVASGLFNVSSSGIQPVSASATSGGSNQNLVGSLTPTATGLTSGNTNQDMLNGVLSNSGLTSNQNMPNSLLGSTGNQNLLGSLLGNTRGQNQNLIGNLLGNTGSSYGNKGSAGSNHQNLLSGLLGGNSVGTTNSLSSLLGNSGTQNLLAALLGNSGLSNSNNLLSGSNSNNFLSGASSQTANKTGAELQSAGNVTEGLLNLSSSITTLPFYFNGTSQNSIPSTLASSGLLNNKAASVRALQTLDLNKMLQSLQNQAAGATDLATGLSTLGTSLLGGMNTLNSQLAEGTVNMGGNLLNLNSGLGNLLGNVNSNLGSSLNNVGGGLSNLATNLGGLGSNIDSGIANIANQTSSGLSQTGGWSQYNLSSLGEGLASLNPVVIPQNAAMPNTSGAATNSYDQSLANASNQIAKNTDTLLNSLNLPATQSLDASASTSNIMQSLLAQQNAPLSASTSGTKVNEVQSFDPASLLQQSSNQLSNAMNSMMNGLNMNGLTNGLGNGLTTGLNTLNPNNLLNGLTNNNLLNGLTNNNMLSDLTNGLGNNNLLNGLTNNNLLNGLTNNNMLNSLTNGADNLQNQLQNMLNNLGLRRLQESTAVPVSASLDPTTLLGQLYPGLLNQQQQVQLPQLTNILGSLGQPQLPNLSNLLGTNTNVGTLTGTTTTANTGSNDGLTATDTNTGTTTITGTGTNTNTGLTGTSTGAGTATGTATDTNSLINNILGSTGTNAGTATGTVSGASTSTNLLDPTNLLSSLTNNNLLSGLTGGNNLLGNNLLGSNLLGGSTNDLLGGFNQLLNGGGLGQLLGGTTTTNKQSVSGSESSANKNLQSVGSGVLGSMNLTPSSSSSRSQQQQMTGGSSTTTHVQQQQANQQQTGQQQQQQQQMSSTNSSKTQQVTLNQLLNELVQSNFNVTEFVNQLAASGIDFNSLVHQGVQGSLTAEEVLKTIASSQLDLNQLLQNVANSGLDANDVVNALANSNLNVDQLAKQLAASGIDINQQLENLSKSGLNLDNLLAMLNNSGVNLDLLASTGALPTMLSAGSLANTNLASILSTLGGGAATNSNNQSGNNQNNQQRRRLGGLRDVWKFSENELSIDNKIRH